MVFCNLAEEQYLLNEDASHNPYFNRWFSAIWDGYELREFIMESQSLF